MKFIPLGLTQATRLGDIRPAESDHAKAKTLCVTTIVTGFERRNISLSLCIHFYSGLAVKIQLY